MRAKIDIVIIPLCNGGRDHSPLISPMQQSLAETRRSFPELIGTKMHVVDGFLRKQANVREIHAPGADELHKSDTMSAMLRCISRIRLSFVS